MDISRHDMAVLNKYLEKETIIKEEKTAEQIKIQTN